MICVQTCAQALIASSPVPAEALLGAAQQEELGVMLVGALTALKHNGTIDKAQAGLRELCAR